VGGFAGMGGADPPLGESRGLLGRGGGSIDNRGDITLGSIVVFLGECNEPDFFNEEPGAGV
jgi:hypothetical protein